VARRNKSNGECQNGGAEQSRCGNQSDLRGIESDLGQIDRKHDGGKTIAKAAQCARAIEEQEAGTWTQRAAFELVPVSIDRGQWREPGAGLIVEFINAD
jgi:hypothetical protein